MAASRKLGTVIPGLFYVVSQPDVDFAPLQGPLTIASILPITVMTDNQFALWNVGAVTLGGICDLEAITQAGVTGVQGSFPYQMPTNTCITWTKQAAALALGISLLPF
jgi:hypothetical protein